MAQVYSPAPKSEGKVTSPELHERWQSDLMYFTSRSLEPNAGNRLALICVDIFSRAAYAEPLRSKEPREVADADTEDGSRGRPHPGKGAGDPKGGQHRLRGRV